MSSIPKMASSMLVIMLAVLVCVSLICACFMIAIAQNHHQTVISEIRNSNLDEEVIADCIQNMADKGFDLDVTKEINISSVEYYEVALSYDLVLPIFGNVYTGKLVGYAFPGGYIEVNP